MAGFAHLHVHSSFSFSDGASGIDALVLRAAEHGQSALALTDTNGVTGLPELTRRCARAGIRPIGGAEVILEGGSRLTLLADGPAGFAALCRILSDAALRDPRREGMRVRPGDLDAHADALVCLTGAPPHGLLPRLLRAGQDDAARSALAWLSRCFGSGNVYVEVVRSLAEGEDALSGRLLALADAARVSALATNAVRHAHKADFLAHEALRRIALGLPLGDEHPSLPRNGERWLKPTPSLTTLFADRPDAIENAGRLARRLVPPLDPSVRHYPRYPFLRPGESAFSELAGRVMDGARRRGIADQARLIHELETVRDLGYSDYFLICQAVVEEARRRGIGCALRGSAIGSAALYALGVSDHDPIARRVRFERFLSRARRKPPDIDIDFRHDRRDELQVWLRATFGEDRVAGVANYVTWRGKSLLRDLGKALAFDASELERLRELLWHSDGSDLRERLTAQPELRALSLDPERFGDLFALCAQLARQPRHLGTHASGIVIGDAPLAGIAPLFWAAKGTTLVALDKDDVETPGIGLLKMDQLCLRALTAVDLATSRLRAADPDFDYAGRDRDDPQTLAMIRAAQTVGVFQLESPAQMALQWRLRAERFDDLVHAVALVRPGPLVGGGIAPYLSVRHGFSRPAYPLPELAPILDETCGRILFQDQVLDVVRVVGDFTEDEADVWQKAMTHARSAAEMETLGTDLWARARAKGLKRRAFTRLWRQIQGFSRYGFCHGHSLAFADHAQGTAWLLRHHPAAFLASVLSVEPCGFWPVATVVAEAQRRDVAVLGPCLNRSAAVHWVAETPQTIRASLAAVRTVTPAVAGAIVAGRERGGAFVDLVDAGGRLGDVPREALEWLALAGALDALGVGRRQALWALPAVHRLRSPQQGPLSALLEPPPPLPPTLPEFDASLREHQEWHALGFTPGGHPLRRLRESLTDQGILACAALQACVDGARVTVAGLALRPHRPPVPSGEVVVFLTLEDETGLAQVTVPEAVYERCGGAVLGRGVLAVSGRAAVRGAGVILLAEHACPVTLDTPSFP